MKTELLIQLDGLLKSRQRVFLLAASNMPWDLDIAMLRRLEKRIFIPLPDAASREAMLHRYIPKDMHEDLDFEHYATKLEGYSGSDIKQVCKEACMKPLRRLLAQIEDIQIDEKQKQP
jgi:katanin p60 ATPase-containing subunit A1